MDNDPCQPGRSGAERAPLTDYFAERARSETAVLREGTEWTLSPSALLVQVPAGGINDETVVSR